MREKVDLRVFNVGLVSNPDQEDVPNEAQTEGSTNLDVEVAGKLKGIPKQTIYTSYGANGTISGWIERVDGSNTYHDLVYTDGTDLKVITDFYEESGTIGHVTSGLTNVNAKVIISNNQEVHIGQGKDETSKWLGYISHNQFNSATPSKTPVLTIKDALISQPDRSHEITSVTGHAAATEQEAVFPLGYEYEFKMSFVYDGYQESPLGGLTETFQMTGNADYMVVSLKVASYLSLNPRITGVKVYRRERPFFDSSIYADAQEFLANLTRLSWTKDAIDRASNELKTQRIEVGSLGSWGEYKLVKDIDINDSDWAISGSDQTYSFHDNNEVGASYLRNVGLEEENDRDIAYYTLDYGIAASSNNFLFIGEANHPRLPEEDAAHMIFRSKPYRYDTFDWVNDKLILPTIPKAMKSHRGKLYVWDGNTTYVIDPNLFQIEKIITGRGCSSQRSVVNTDYGLFWANENGVYWSELSENLLKPVQDNLTEPIKSQYQNAVSGQTPILAYNSPRNQLLVHVANDVYAYNTVEKRWDYYQDFTLTDEDLNTGAIIGRDGETYTITEGAIFKDFDSATREYWAFYSKEFVLNDPSQTKKFYKIIGDYSGTVTIEYSTDGGTTWITASTEDIGPVIAKSIKLRISASSETAVLDSVSIIYRRMRGKR